MSRHVWCVGEMWTRTHEKNTSQKMQKKANVSFACLLCFAVVSVSALNPRFATDATWSFLCWRIGAKELVMGRDVQLQQSRGQGHRSVSRWFL